MAGLNIRKLSQKLQGIADKKREIVDTNHRCIHCLWGHLGKKCEADRQHVCKSDAVDDMKSYRPAEADFFTGSLGCSRHVETQHTAHRKY